MPTDDLERRVVKALKGRLEPWEGGQGTRGSESASDFIRRVGPDIAAALRATATATAMGNRANGFAAGLAALKGDT